MTVARNDIKSRKVRESFPYPVIAATIISYLGVDQQLRGNRLGPKTLKQALIRCYKLTEQCGTSMVVVDVETKNDIAIRMYHDADFEDLIDIDTGRYHLLRMFIPMKKIAAAVNRAGMV